MAGIFGLREVRTEQITKITGNRREYGYFGGGYNPPGQRLSIIERIDFSNETVSLPGNNLPEARYNLAALSSPQYGYFASGNNSVSPFYTNVIDRIEFSSETTSVANNNLTQARFGLAGVSNSNYGYFGAGFKEGPAPSLPRVCTVDRLEFSSETVSLPGNNLTQARHILAGTESDSRGYFGGGRNNNSPPVVTARLDFVDFSNETISIANNLPQARNALSAVSTPQYGYFVGGSNGATTYATIDRIEFSSGTTSNPPAALIQARDYLAATESDSYGYFSGGATPSYVCTIERLEFSTETTSNSSGTLSQINVFHAAVSGPLKEYTISPTSWPELAEFGYFGGGLGILSPTRTNRIDRLDFSNETTSAPGNNLIQQRQDSAGVFSPNYGYFGGGILVSGPAVCVIDRLDFSSETTSNLPANLTQGRYELAGVSSPRGYGYFGGGLGPGGYSSRIDRLEFFTETILNPTSPVGNLTQARTTLAAVSNSDYGYFGGGFVPPLSCRIDRLDFSSETTSNPTANLPESKLSLAAVTNPFYGYFGGGYNPVSFVCTIDRLDFSNETISRLPANLTQARWLLSAVSSPQYGYFGGGFAPSAPGHVCTIDRFDFSSETVSAPGAYQLTEARSRLAGVSTKPTTETVRKLRRGVDVSANPISKTYGYFGGGFSPPVLVCTIDRLDFSNETVSAPGAYQLTQARNLFTAVSNSNYGYFGGGNAPGPTRVCTIDRLDFSNETTLAPGNTLTQPRWDLGAVSNSNYGYFAGGFAPPAVPVSVCTIDRLDFSNETVSAPGTYQLTEAKNSFAAVSTPQYGYFGGGQTPPYVCTIDRLDFSNETVSAPGNCRLTDAREKLGAVSNSNYGYFAGGFTPGAVCTIDRLDFSNETVQIPPAPAPNQLTQARFGLAAVYSSYYGYFGGGTPGGSAINTIDRLEFSSETVSAPGNNLTQARASLAAVSN